MRASALSRGSVVDLPSRTFTAFLRKSTSKPIDSLPLAALAAGHCERALIFGTAIGSGPGEPQGSLISSLASRQLKMAPGPTMVDWSGVGAGAAGAAGGAAAGGAAGGAVALALANVA